ncbi:family 20 glycosylhydrolase [Edaphobacter sp. HDX4]|uniref:family 20 glycosylhydrolase n=1 Tax=Edaphobacter sp. HDX4 TaxID=2794064 RepID=UPI002FE6A762
MMDKSRTFLSVGRVASFGIVVALAAFATQPVVARTPALIPMPAHLEPSAGTLILQDGAEISYPAMDDGARFSAMHLAELLKRTRGLSLRVVESVGTQDKAAIVFERTADPMTNRNKEAYDLVVGRNAVKISAASSAGLYYGSVTLWQLVTDAAGDKGTVQLECVAIQDAPELPWRGIMLDSARHMQSVTYIKQLIDRISLEKLNVLHWHLTDDQGWRLEIKRYPKLTQVGGFRRLPHVFGSAAKPTGPNYGGFYTQAEVRDLVKYAAQRNVMIVPEIEMPGHASAPLAAYPQFGSTDLHLTAPASEYGIFPYLYNVDDKTFEFLENILTEVMDLFPSPYIHVGGDEAIKDQWKSSATIQAQMKKLGIVNEDALQSYFIKRIDTFITAHHRRTLGWDEILEGGLAPNAAVMSWHGIAGGISAAKQGHDAVLAPVRPLYFNYRQTDSASEAPGRFALNSLQSVYNFDPLPPSLTADERKHILGIQANLWTEYVQTGDRVTWMIFPRAAALAEVAWAPSHPRNWNEFTSRVAVELQRYRKLGIVYDPNAFRVNTQETIETSNTVMVALSNQAGVGSIRYTLDGSPVTRFSMVYRDPFSVQLPARLRAATFMESEVAQSDLDRTLDSASVRVRYSQDLQLCVNDPAIAMQQDPPQGSRPVVLVNYKNPCWIYKGANLNGITQISAGVMALPYVFRDKNKQAPPLGDSKTKAGEVEVHLDSCTGKLLATIPIGPADRHPGVTLLSAPLERSSGVHDLCVKVVRPTVTPLWGIYSIGFTFDEHSSPQKVEP